MAPTLDLLIQDLGFRGREIEEIACKLCLAPLFGTNLYRVQ